MCVCVYHHMCVVCVCAWFCVCVCVCVHGLCVCVCDVYACMCVCAYVCVLYMCARMFVCSSVCPCVRHSTLPAVSDVLIARAELRRTHLVSVEVIIPDRRFVTIGFHWFNHVVVKKRILVELAAGGRHSITRCFVLLPVCGVLKVGRAVHSAASNLKARQTDILYCIVLY